MGKVLKAVAVIAIAVAVAYFAPQLLPSALSFLGTATAAAITTAVVSAAIAVAVNTSISLLAGKPSTSGSSPSVFRQAVSNSFIIYGKRRVGGLLIFFHPIGKDSRYFVIAVAGHQCRGVVRWFLGDEQVTVDDSGKVTSGKYANSAWLWFYRGTPDQQAHPTFVAETGGKWSAQHRGRGTALIYAKFKMTDDVVQAGMPNITAEIEGKDTILDVRDETVGYTRNAQLIFRDWMATPREEGGFGAYPDELDDTWDALNASVCDEDVAIPGGTEKRYEFDAYITTGAAPSEIRDTLVTCCAGSFTYSGGKMLMRPGYYVPSSAMLSEDDLAGPITIPALLAGDEIANEVTGTFIDPSTLYQAADVPTRSVYASDVRQHAVDLPHITSIYRGQRILEYLLRKSNAERRVTWPMNIAGIAISTLDTVQIATARYGLSNYAFQVTGWGLSQDFSVVLQLEEHSPELFEFDPDGYLDPGEVPQLTQADPIKDATVRAAYYIVRQSVAYPLDSDSDSITIVAFDATIDDGRMLSFPAQEIDGLTPGTTYLVLWDLTAMTFVAVPAPALNESASSNYVIVRQMTTQNVDGTYPSEPTAPGGDGGGGVGGGGCPVVTARILLANADRTGPGGTIAAGDLEAGAWVWTQHETTREWGAYRVTATRVFDSPLYAVGDRPLTSPSHLWGVDGGWSRSDVLGKPAGTGKVVALSVAEARTYVIVDPDGALLLSHNKQAVPENP